MSCPITNKVVIGRMVESETMRPVSQCDLSDNGGE